MVTPAERGGEIQAAAEPPAVTVHWILVPEAAVLTTKVSPLEIEVVSKS